MKSAINKAWEHGGADFQSRFDNRILFFYSPIVRHSLAEENRQSEKLHSTLKDEGIFRSPVLKPFIEGMKPW
jgi:hypothetical protein